MKSYEEELGALLDERVKRLDAGETQTIPGSEVYERLMIQALGNFITKTPPLILFKIILKTLRNELKIRFRK